MTDDFAGMVLGSFERAPWGWAMLGTLVLALVKGWPAIVDAASRAKAARVAEQRDEDKDLAGRVRSLEAKFETASARAADLDKRLVAALAAYRLIASELTRKDPGNVILHHAQELLGLVASIPYPTKDPGLNAGLDAMASVPAITEPLSTEGQA